MLIPMVLRGVLALLDGVKNVVALWFILVVIVLLVVLSLSKLFRVSILFLLEVYCFSLLLVFVLGDFFINRGTCRLTLAYRGLVATGIISAFDGDGDRW